MIKSVSKQYGLISFGIFCCIAMSFLACQKETYVVEEKEGFQSYLDASVIEVKHAELPGLYFYDFLGNDYPAMAKGSIGQWVVNGSIYSSGAFAVQDLPRNKVKIGILADIIEGKVFIKEIRKSWSCYQEGSYGGFSNESCN